MAVGWDEGYYSKTESALRVHIVLCSPQHHHYIDRIGLDHRRIEAEHNRSTRKLSLAWSIVFGDLDLPRACRASFAVAWELDIPILGAAGTINLSASTRDEHMGCISK